MRQPPRPSQPIDEDTTYLLPPTSARTRPPAVVVRVAGAEASPAFLRLSQGACVLGSASGCDIVIADPSTSRQHLELRLVPQGVAARDLGSTNGTYYLGSRIQEIVLPIGGAVSIGGATVVVEPDAETSDSSLEFTANEYRGMVGASPLMRRLFALLVRLEGSLVPVLIQGESGVGKELIARALHDGSKVASGPFVVVNCGAIPRELIVSELFGHRKGAFTGALDARTGAFESADGGTLFLDEIGELPIDMQPVLLRALESGEVRPVGSDQARRVKVRVIAATNRDLFREVDEQRFRRDLLYRLAVVRLDVPPLRERVEDIEPLAQRFALGSGVGELPPDVVARLRSRSYPGNARELRNVVQAYAALGVVLEQNQPKEALLDAAVAGLIDLKRPFLEQKEALSDRFTQIYLKGLLEQTRGNKSAAARLSGLDRTYLGRLLAKHGFNE